jgi:prepilin-type processing-associated H-X9-DG protein
MMEEKKMKNKGVSPAIIFFCAVFVMAGFFYLRFPYVHPHRLYTTELYLYGNIAACVFFVFSLIAAKRRRFCRMNLIALLFLILGIFSILLQLCMDHFRIDIHLSAKILLATAAISGALAGISALLGFFFGRSIRDALLSIAVLFLLCINLVLPEFTPRTGNSRAIICRSQLKMLCVAVEIHKNDYDGHISNPGKWCDLLHQECDVETERFRCPKDLFGPCSYAINENIPADANALPGDLVLLFESDPGWNQTGGVDDVVTDRHGKPGANIAFADGHVEFVKPEDIPALRWTVE